MDLISVIFEALGSIITSVVGWFGDMFTGVAGLFYTAPVAPATTGTLTLLGTLSLVAVGVAAFYGVFRLISGLIQLKVAK